MVKIRLARHGTKKRPFYKMIIADSRFSRNGRFIEKIGYFNPIATGQSNKIQVNFPRIEYWMKQGAQMSERVKKIIKIANEKK